MPPDEQPEQLEIRLVLEAIHARYGYDFRGYASDSIARRVRAVAAQTGVQHLGELQHRLILDPAFFESVLDTLTVRVTEMFRDPPFYRAFRERVVPVLRTYPELKVWHAGCASGEEVYATAILLAEEGLYERAHIYATDVSRAAIEQGREGVYPQERLALFARNYVEGGGRNRFDAYWSEAYDRAAVRETLRKNVHFFHHDLVSDYTLGEMHVIFCRNVLIYFGSRLRERVFSTFASSLRRGGFLCLGNSEALPDAESSRYYEISVADSGTGIAEDIRERVVEPFFTTKPIGKGTGLGLSITYSIVKKHEGTLEFVPSSLGGTLASIRLPLRPG